MQTYGEEISLYRILGNERVELGKFVTIEDSCFLDAAGKSGSICIGNRSKLKCGAVIRSYGGDVRIGDRVTIGEYTVIAGHGGVDIGNKVIIAGHCYIAASQHIYCDESSVRFQGETLQGIIIGEGTWIGGRVSILDGVKIGKNCIIGAGSIVTKNMPDEYVCFGIPCIPIRHRNERR